MKDYYRILDIPINADKSDIEKAYKKLKNLVLNKSLSLYSLVPSEEKSSFLDEVEEAYNVLINPEKRRNYDILLRGATYKNNNDRDTDSIKQLSFAFAREAFTYVDYTRKAEKIQIETPIKIKSAYLTHSEGLSIKIIEEENNEEGTREQDNTSRPISLKEENHIISHTSNFQNITELPQKPQATYEKSDSITSSETNTSLKASENTTKISQIEEQSTVNNLHTPLQATTENQTNSNTPQSQLQEETKEEIVIDENTEFSGPLLKKIRESKGISIKDIAKTTKISTANILYIEEENYNSLPALVYIKGYLAQIAKCLSIKPDIVVRSYIARMNERLERQEKKNR